MKAFADNKSNVTQNMKFVFGRVENIVGKGENAGNLHFLLFPQYFQNASFSMLLKSQVHAVRGFKGSFYDTIQLLFIQDGFMDP